MTKNNFNIMVLEYVSSLGEKFREKAFIDEETYNDIVIDLIDLKVKNDDEFKYILHICDHFSRYSWAKPITSKKDILDHNIKIEQENLDVIDDNIQVCLIYLFNKVTYLLMIYLINSRKRSNNQKMNNDMMILNPDAPKKSKYKNHTTTSFQISTKSHPGRYRITSPNCFYIITSSPPAASTISSQAESSPPPGRT
ncbi:hypothetical protein C1645_836662 [Glomus cerebriforme]|uniref:Integrase catalytic domain-containing protein n=1 Tax=Glomus cerebriforme TaxID=658196 RepID=A0A397S838_9GLOM|nr:hypothetical protein C1645_836662 [Glomus cerebriforme]